MVESIRVILVATASSSADPPSATARPLEGVRVLVIEDDDAAREVLGHVLRQRGATVDEADSGQSAVDLYYAAPPDVVLSDIVMPRVDGRSVIRYLRRFGMRVPAIAVTGLDTADDRFQSAQAGFDLHLAKPVAPEIVVRAILDVLGRV